MGHLILNIVWIKSYLRQGCIAGIIIDDLGSGGADHTDCACNLSLMLDALESYQVQVGGDKLELSSTALPFLGYLLK